MACRATDVRDAALGCFLGSCIGDAAGATLEFMDRIPDLLEVTRALEMPGGGVLDVAPGQVTDDSELALCLARGLSKSRSFEIEEISRSYAEWVRSEPFDMGWTTRHSLACFDERYALFQEGEGKKKRCDTGAGAHGRPPFLHPRQIPDWVESILI